MTSADSGGLRSMRARLRKEYSSLSRDQLLELLLDFRSDQMLRFDRAVAQARSHFARPSPRLARPRPLRITLQSVEKILREAPAGGVHMKEIAQQLYADRETWPSRYPESIRQMIVRIEQRCALNGEVVRRVPPRGQTRYRLEPIGGER